MNSEVSKGVAAKREVLLRRLERLHTTAKKSRGYRTAISLLNKRLLVASKATQVALLQAASFMIDVTRKTSAAHLAFRSSPDRNHPLMRRPIARLHPRAPSNIREVLCVHFP